MASEGSQVPPATSGFATAPPGGFPEGYGKAAQESLRRGYGWVLPDAEVPPGWQLDPQTNQLLPPGQQPAGQRPAGLLPGYRWIAPGTPLPEGWSIDPETDELIPPESMWSASPGMGSQAGPTPWTSPEADGGSPLAEAPWPQVTEASGQGPEAPPPQPPPPGSYQR